VLRTVQEAIEATERVIEAAKELKRSMMEYLFTYGPVPVDQAERVELQEGEFGRAPQAWEICKLGDAARIVSGGTPSRQEAAFWEGGTIPWVKTGEVAYEKIFDTEEKITEVGLAHSSARMIPAGTLLVAMYGQGITRGRAAILGIDAAINQACAAILPRSAVSSDYLLTYFAHNYERVRSLGHGAHQKNLSAALLNSIPLLVPDEDAQQRMVVQLGAISAMERALKERLRSLDNLFHSLLDNLMTGKVRVPPTEQDMEASE
jgi:type I restriction enzyme S subunit